MPQKLEAKPGGVPKPAQSAGGELSPDDLVRVSGGITVTKRTDTTTSADAKLLAAAGDGTKVKIS